MVAINIYNITRSNRGTGDPLQFPNFPILGPDVRTNFGPIWASTSGPEQTFVEQGQVRPDARTKLGSKRYYSRNCR